MNLWLVPIAVASAYSVQLPATPPPSPHIHYEVVLTARPADPPRSDAQRLRDACALTNSLSARLAAEQKRDAQLSFVLIHLQTTTCSKSKS